MLHPSNAVVNFEEMGNSSEPQNDRELLLKLNSDVNYMTESFNVQVSRLTESIDRLVESINHVKDVEIVVLKKDVDALKAWRNEWMGSGKLFAYICMLIAASGGIVLLAIRLA